MPITNNIITIDGAPLRPAPTFNISYESFKAGEYIVGGLLRLSIQGEIYGASAENLSSKIADISAYSATCREILISCDGETLVNGNGFINSVTISPTDQPFMVNYNFDIELAISNGVLCVTRDVAFLNLLDISIPDNLNIKTYEENLSLSGDDTLGNTGFYGGNTYTKAQLKLSGQITIQAYHHMCDSTGDIIESLYTVINNRFNKIMTLDNNIAISYPTLASYCNGDYTAIHDNKTFTINKFDNNLTIQFDMYVIPNLPLGAYPTSIVDITIAENTDQITGFSTLSVKGSVKGLSNRTTNILDNKIISSEKLTNARNAYASIIDSLDNHEYEHFIVLGCFDGVSPPLDICNNRISSQITENLNGGQIDFDLGYGDIQSCQLGGANIDVNITENFPTQNFVEHIIPGRGYPVIQVGSNLTPMKIQLTVAGKLNGCDTSKIPTLINCVDARLTQEKNTRGYQSYLLVSHEKTLGTYSYKIVENYIGFDAVEY